MKTCTNCCAQKPLEAFYYRKDRNKYRNDCKTCSYKRKKEYYRENKKDIKTKINQYRKENRAHVLHLQKVWSKKNRKRISEKEKERYHNDKTFRLKIILRRRLRLVIEGKNKSASTQTLTGCTWEYLKQWIESQMTDTMTFDTIHIDHMMPLASFDLTKPEEQRKACHYTNLQPMLPSENMSKGSQIVHDMRWNGKQWEINRSGTYLPRDKELI